MSLGPTSRNLVAAARHGLDPSPDVAARVRAKVALAVGGATSVASTSAGRASVLSGKLVALIAAGALVVTTWLVVHSASPPAVPPAISTPSLTTSDEPQVEPHFTSSVHAEPAPLAPIVAKVVPPPPPVIETPVAPVVAPAPVTPATLAREVALLDAAMASLHENDPADTLATLAIYDRETLGHGQLAEDASALEIEARCRTNEPVADKLATFDQRWPHSVQRARITERCSDASHPQKVQLRGIEPAN
jgi:hypothetical protein